MTVANQITLVRILLIPVFVVFAVYYSASVRNGMPEDWLRWAAVAAFVIAAASDGLDGWIARRFNQRSALVAFLKRPLTDTRVTTATGPFEHPTLYGGSSRMPTLFGAPTAGSGGFIPRMVALSPALVGNDRFTVGVEGGLGGGFSGLILDVVPNAVGTPFGDATAYLGFSPGARYRRVGPLFGSGAGQGWGSSVIPIDNNPALVGTPLYGQWFVRDPGSGGRFSASAAFAVTHF